MTLNPEGLFPNLGNLLKLVKDENFRKFLAHPKVQVLMTDSAFKAAIEEKNVFKLMGNQQFAELMSDHEVRSMLEAMSKKI